IVAMDMTAEITADVGASALLRISLVYLQNLEMAEAIIGERRFPIVSAASNAAPDRHMLFLGLNGPTERGILASFSPRTIRFFQAGDTVRLETTDFAITGIIP